MKSHLAVALLSSAFCACASVPRPFGVPSNVVGTASHPIHTGWRLDFCNEKKPVSFVPECVQIGGEIYKVTLRDVRTTSGELLTPHLVIGFPAHALTKKYGARVRMHLDRSPVDFGEATGIEYLAKDWGRM